MSKEEGLKRKYFVQRVDGREVEWAFVLNFTDPFAIPALECYRDIMQKVGYTALAVDLDTKILQMKAHHCEKGRTDCDAYKHWCECE